MVFSLHTCMMYLGSNKHFGSCFVCLFFNTPINQFLIILGMYTLYTLVCLLDEPTCMRIESVCVGIFSLHRG